MRRAATAGLVASASYGVFEAIAALTPGVDRNELGGVHAQRLGGRILRVLGVELDLGGQVPPRVAGRGQVVEENHRAATDIGVLLTLFGGALVARGDMATWPLVGLMAARTGTIFVDREDKRSGARAVRVMRRRLAQGATLAIFPEGTTFLGDEVRSFQPGAFVAARGLDVDIVPVGIALPRGLEYVGTTFGAHVSRIAAREKTLVTAVVGEALRPAQGARELAEACRAQVESLVVRARHAQERT